MSSDTLFDKDATISERYAVRNEAIQAEYSIDPFQDPYELPIEEVTPGHPSFYECDTVDRIFERLRTEDPVHYTADSMFGPFWSITKYNDIVEIEKAHDVFSSEQRYGGIQLGGVPYDEDEPDPVFNLPMFIMMDPPKHDKQRAAVQPMFLQRPLQRMEPVIRQRVEAILDELPIDEEFDWVEKVSIELTGQMLATFFDIPQEDRHKLIFWSNVVQNAANPHIFTSIQEAFGKLWECHEYFSKVWEQRKAQPEVGNDLISMLVSNEATSNMPPNEFLGNVLLLIVGGNDTTRNSISGGVLRLNQFPAEYDKLMANPDLIPSMVAESIRYQTPVAHMARTALRDVDFRGKNIRKGDRVALWYTSGNRDEEVIPYASEFRIDRPNPRQHLAFGFGIHRCVGLRLAEMQLRVLWEEILKRFTRIEVVGDPVFVWSCFLHGIKHLPVKITA